MTYYNVDTGVNAPGAWNRAGTTLTITCDVRPEYANRNCVNGAASYRVGVRARNAVGESSWTDSSDLAGLSLSVADASADEPAEGVPASPVRSTRRRTASRPSPQSRCSA